MSLKRTSSAAGLPDRADEEAPCCWLCLEEGPDDSGKPLVRNCSCRGTSGFAHHSCMVKYAESKSREADQKGRDLLNEFFFAFCPNCNQTYQGEVEYAMAEAQVKFVEREYKNDIELNLYALSYKIGSLARIKGIKKNEEQYRREGENICSKLLPIIEQMKQNVVLKQDEDMKSTIAAAHYSVGQFCEQFSSKEYLEKAKKHFESGKELFDELGEGVYAVMMERKTREIEAKMSGNEPKLDTTEEITYWQNRYNQSKSSGENDTSTIYQGVELALALFNAHHSIESERFLTKLMQICRRVHGQDHRMTKYTLEILEHVKMRLVHLGTGHPYQALRYENNGESIVVQGPIIDEEKRDGEKILNIDTKDVIPYPGTPMVVHSLRRNSRFNGKIGDFRAYSEDKRASEIHFEEKGLKPALVKLEHVRILFDLPEKEDTEESK